MQETQADDLPESEIHHVLSNERRRMVIEILEEDGSIGLRELSEQIASQETGESPPPRDARRSVYVSLKQTHIPKLEELKIISYDEDAKEVNQEEHASDVAVYMEVVPKYGLAWSEFYFALGLLGLLSTLAAGQGIPPFATVGVAGVAALSLVVIMLAASYQTYAQGSSVLDRIQNGE